VPVPVPCHASPVLTAWVCRCVYPRHTLPPLGAVNRATHTTICVPPTLSTFLKRLLPRMHYHADTLVQQTRRSPALHPRLPTAACCSPLAAATTTITLPRRALPFHTFSCPLRAGLAVGMDILLPGPRSTIPCLPTLMVATLLPPLLGRQPAHLPRHFHIHSCPIPHYIQVPHCNTTHPHATPTPSACLPSFLPSWFGHPLHSLHTSLPHPRLLPSTTTCPCLVGPTYSPYNLCASDGERANMCIEHRAGRATRGGRQAGRTRLTCSIQRHGWDDNDCLRVCNAYALALASASRFA